MRVLFTVQGEGRGHLTQALALREMLARRGHRVVGVVVGSNGTRPVPGYFTAAFDVPVQTMASPGFAFKNACGVSVWGSLAGIVRLLPACRRSLRGLRRLLRRTAPDLVVNFLEPIMGLHNLVSGARVPTLVVGHQYMLEHPDYVKVPRFRVEQTLMRAYIRLVGARSTRLALSFYPASDRPRPGLHVCPPLLRQQLFDLKPTAGDYLLVYLLNHGYADAIRRWHMLHPHIPVHCFYDRSGAPAEERVPPNLTFHRLDGEKFLRLMAGARGVACTAGFESVSEAAYLGKPLLMVPVENHVEQFVNACDAEQAGIGVRDTAFRLSRLLAANAQAASPEIRRWIDRAEAVAMQVVESVAGLRPASALPAPAAGVPVLTREPAA